MMKSNIKSVFKHINKNEKLNYAIIAFVTTFMTEVFSRNSFTSALNFFVRHFFIFCMNYFIVFSVMILVLFTKKKTFWKYTVSFLWILLGLISFIMYHFRMMPFSFIDILLIPSTFTVIPKYLSVLQMILAAACIITLVFLLVFLYKKSKIFSVRIKKNIPFAITVFTCTVLYVFFMAVTGFVDVRVSGLTNKYQKNGFVYCFFRSAIDMGMHEPNDYSSQEVATIINDVESDEKEASVKANIIFLQLESFFDVHHVKNVSYSEDPIPVFTELQKKYSHGYLKVPTFSAGTANTEFEVLTGMNIDFFGIGEFPYQTIGKSKTIESMAYCLKNIGYSTHAIHDNSATFYDRNLIYPNLGFDTFTSIEYMYDVKYNVLGWARDSALIDPINDAFDSSDDKDFIYTVAVQTHGTYPNDVKDSAKKIYAYGVSEEIREQYEYYLSQIHEVDTFVGDLISNLEKRDEPTVLVIFGDHMPGFDFGDGRLDDKYQTEYVLWSNFSMDNINKDLHSYQLYSYVLDRLNLNGGTLSKLHKKYNYIDSDIYSDKFEIVQYDMIYGSGDACAKKYKPTNMKMGIRNIKIKNVKISENKLNVLGENFNEYSVIYINGKRTDSSYIDHGKLVSNGILPKRGDKISVAQEDEHGHPLSFSNEYVYK